MDQLDDGNFLDVDLIHPQPPGGSFYSWIADCIDRHVHDYIFDMEQCPFVRPFTLNLLDATVNLPGKKIEKIGGSEVPGLGSV